MFPFQKKKQKEITNQDQNEQLLNYQQKCLINDAKSQKWLNSAFNKTSNLLLLANHAQIKVFQFKSADLKQILTFYGNQIGTLHSIKNQDQFIFINLKMRYISTFIGMNNGKALNINSWFQNHKYQQFILNKKEDLLIEYGDGFSIFKKQNSSWKLTWNQQYYSYYSSIHIEEYRNMLICKVDFWKDGDGLLQIYQKKQNEFQDTWECVQNIPIMILNSICYLNELKVIIILDPKRNLKFYQFNIKDNQFQDWNDKINTKIQKLTFTQHDIIITFDGIHSIVGIEENKQFISAYQSSRPIDCFSTKCSISNYGQYLIIHSNKQSEIRQLQLISIN